LAAAFSLSCWVVIFVGLMLFVIRPSLSSWMGREALEREELSAGLLTIVGQLGSYLRLLHRIDRYSRALRSIFGCSGTRRPAIPWIYSSRRRWPNSIPRRWRPAKNLFSHQDARNLLRYGGMRPEPRLAAIRLRAVLWALRISAHARRAANLRLVARADAFRMAAIRCRLNIAAGLGLGGKRKLSGSFPGPMAVSPTAFASRTAALPCRTCRVSASRESPISTQR